MRGTRAAGCADTCGIATATPVATARLSRHLDLTPPSYAEGQAVKLIVESETPLGYKAIINHAHLGLLYRAELAGPLSVGQALDEWRQVAGHGVLQRDHFHVGRRGEVQCADDLAQP